MKIKIITIHDIGINFGSTLQACALYDFIRSKGYNDVEVIHYKPLYAYHHGKIGQLIKRIIFLKDSAIQNRRFKEYYTKHCKLTKKYAANDLLVEEKDADVFIVGSDQVWNEYYDAGRDLAYYLEFTDCKNKMSYASSVGQIQAQDAILRLKERVKDFIFISVRETISAIQLREAGLKNVNHVLDPIFLQEKEYYINPNFKNRYGKYILVYVVHSDTFMSQMVTKIAKQLGAKVVLVGGFIQKIYHDYYLRDIGPSEFVNLIYHASFVVANSFHAAAFSILFNKQFVLFQPKVSALRLSSMLETAGITDKIIISASDFERAMKPVNYNEVNKIMKQKQNNSREYLLNCLSYFSNGADNEKKEFRI